jgi:dienelactone hydrolase
VKSASRNSSAFLIVALLFLGCGKNDDARTGAAGDGVRQAVKDVVTKEFKLYEGAKHSLKESEERAKSQQEMIDKELK